MKIDIFSIPIGIFTNDSIANLEIIIININGNYTINFASKEIDINQFII
jgi:hypothetical protein